MMQLLRIILILVLYDILRMDSKSVLPVYLLNPLPATTFLHFEAYNGFLDSIVLSVKKSQVPSPWQNQYKVQ